MLKGYVLIFWGTLVMAAAILAMLFVPPPSALREAYMIWIFFAVAFGGWGAVIAGLMMEWRSGVRERRIAQAARDVAGKERHGIVIPFRPPEDDPKKPKWLN